MTTLELTDLCLFCALSGLGMLIESDFYTTPVGREHFSNQIQSIRCE